MLAGIKEILIITTSEDQSAFKNLLGDGTRLGISLTFETQDKPDGLARAFTIGEQFIGESGVALILGDNIFHGGGLGRDLQKSVNPVGSKIFGYQVKDPERYGVVEISHDGSVVSIEEKPKSPKSNLAIPGLYFFDNTVVAKAKMVKLSPRGEYEITSILDMYRIEGALNLTVIPRGTTWMDCGTTESLNDASNYVRAIEERQGNKISVIEEIAWRNNWITTLDLQKIALTYGDNKYGRYLDDLSTQ